jgi:hypothetical protein
MTKIKLHSITDLITNSSNTIFTYSKGSESALKDMITELFKVFNINKTCDEIFKLVVLCDVYVYGEYISGLLEDEESLPEGITEETDIKLIYNDVKTGKTEKPAWFKPAEEHTDGEGFNPDTYLHLIPLEQEYSTLATLVRKFLYSTSHEASHNG